MAGRRTSTGLLLRLGEGLRHLREVRGLTPTQAEALSGVSKSHLGRIEQGVHRPARRTLIALVQAYGVTDPARHTQLLNWLKQDARLDEPTIALSEPDRSRLDLEVAAARLRSFATTRVPALLQTREYAQAMLAVDEPAANPDRAEQLGGLLIRRQQLLDTPDGPTLHAVIDEAVLRRKVGGTTTTRDQLRHLADAAGKDNIVVQVVAFAAGAHPGPISFDLLDFDDPFNTVFGYFVTSTGADLLRETPTVTGLADRFDRLTQLALGRSESVKLIEQAAANL